MNKQTLKRHELDFMRTYPYFLGHIRSKKALAQRIEKQIDFRKGSFFTLLPENAFLNNLYRFDSGLIIPQTEPIVQAEGGAASWQRVTNLNDSLGEVVWSFLCEKDSNFAICESYDLRLEDPNIQIENVALVSFEQEVYYSLDARNSLEEVTITVTECKWVWHFLGVLAAGEHQFSDRFTQSDFERIIAGSKYLITSAYDDEGFIIWERST